MENKEIEYLDVDSEVDLQESVMLVTVHEDLDIELVDLA